MGLLALVAVLVLGLVGGTVGIYKRIQRKHEAAKLAQAAQAAAAAAAQSAAHAVAVPAVDEKMRDTVGRMNAMLTAIETYRSAKKQLPSSLMDLGKVMEDPQMRSDAWGNPLIYLVDLSNNTFVLSSGGPDGKRETNDDLKVTDDSLAQWREKNHEIVEEWRVANLDLFQKLSGEQILSDTKAAQERKRLEREKAKAEAAAQQAAALAAQQKHQEELRRQQEAAAAAAAQLAAQQQQQEEARRRVEEEMQRQRAEAERRARLEKMTFTDTFDGGLGRWSTSSFQVVSEKGRPTLRVEGFGLLKDGSDWENYTVTFDVKIQKEGVNFIIRARDRQNFYFLKLTEEKAKINPKNSLIKYVYAGGKYVGAVATNDATGATAVVALPFKIKRNETHRIVISVSGNTIRTTINGQLVDTWQDSTFRQGSFGFNCTEQEQATVSTFQMRPN
jgi:type II secretory pathway pseudopilin PulG